MEGLEQPGVCSVGGGVVEAGAQDDPLAGHAGVDALQGEVGPLSDLLAGGADALGGDSSVVREGRVHLSHYVNIVTNY